MDSISKFFNTKVYIEIVRLNTFIHLQVQMLHMHVSFNDICHYVYARKDEFSGALKNTSHD
jgi:hypothetical protein